jgi:hypothetical protein
LKWFSSILTSVLLIVSYEPYSVVHKLKKLSLTSLILSFDLTYSKNFNLISNLPQILLWTSFSLTILFHISPYSITPAILTLMPFVLFLTFHLSITLFSFFCQFLLNFNSFHFFCYYYSFPSNEVFTIFSIIWTIFSAAINLFKSIHFFMKGFNISNL